MEGNRKMTRFVETARNAAVDAVADLADGGRIEFRTGSAPASPDGNASGTLLVSVNLDSDAFSAASDGEVEANGLPLESTGQNDGTIGHARVLDSSNTVIYDEDDISTEQGSKIVVNTLTVSDGVAFEITSYVLRARNPSS